MNQSTDSPCDEPRALLAANALGERELDSDVRRHLETCAACRQAYQEYLAVARAIPMAAPDVAPPTELRARIIAAVEGAERGQTALPAPQPPEPAQRSTPRGRLLGGWPALAAALAVLVALLGWNIALQSQLDAQTAQLARSRDGWQAAIALFNDPELMWYDVRGQTARGSLWTTPGDDVGCLMVQELPPLASTQVYQVWFLDGTRSASGGLFEPRTDNGWVIVRPGAPIDSYTEMSVTVEPRGGSPTPIGLTVLAGTLDAARQP